MSIDRVKVTFLLTDPQMSSSSFAEQLKIPTLPNNACLLLHQTRTNPNKPVVLVVDGEIAAGKSTLTRFICRKMNERGVHTVCVKEPVETWKDVGILQAFYRDQRKYAYKFQTYVFVTRIEEVLREFAQDPNADLYVLDRSIFTDAYVFMNMLAQNGILEDVERTMYLQWWHMWANVMPIVPSAFLYHKPSLKKCMENYYARAREGEVLDLDYQKNLRAAHELFFDEGIVLVGNTAKGEEVLAPVFLNEDDRDIFNDPDYQGVVIEKVMKIYEQCKASAQSLGTKLKYAPVCELEARTGCQCNHVVQA